MSQLFHDLVVAWFQFTLDWGYLGIIIMMALESTAVPVPAEVVIPPAAFWASQGKLSFWGVVIAATVGSYIGSAFSYWIALKLGRPFFLKYGRYFFLKEEKLEMADRWFVKYGAGGIFLARLTPVIRHLISLPAGLCRMNFKNFSLMTIFGAFSYCAALSWFGQIILGDHPDLMKDPMAMIHVVKSKFIWLFAGVLFAGVCYYLIHRFQKKATV